MVGVLDSFRGASVGSLKMILVSNNSGTRKRGTNMEGQVQWETELDKALARAKSEKKPVLLDFFNSLALWFVFARGLERLFNGDAGTLSHIADFVRDTSQHEHPELTSSTTSKDNHINIIFLGILEDFMSRVAFC